jgi:hypothetical protein
MATLTIQACRQQSNAGRCKLAGGRNDPWRASMLADPSHNHLKGFGRQTAWNKRTALYIQRFQEQLLAH